MQFSELSIIYNGMVDKGQDIVNLFRRHVS